MQSNQLTQTQIKRKMQLQTVIENISAIQLPSSLWGVHLDSNHKFVAFSQLNINDDLTQTTKSVVLAIAKGDLKVDILMNNKSVEIPYISKTVTTVPEISYLLKAVNDVQFCKHYMKNKRNGCLSFSSPFTNVCSWCSNAQETEAEFKFSCILCETQFQSLEKLMVHEGYHLQKNNGLFECTICVQTFRTIEEMLQHYKSWHGDVKFIKCTECDGKFARINLLRRHLRSHSKFGRYICKRCKKRFILKSEWKTHSCKRTTVPQGGNKSTKRTCPKCNKKYATTLLLKQHSREHEMKEQSQNSMWCRKCCRGFESFEMTLIHKEICDAKDKKYDCKVCGYKLSCISQKMYHMSKYDKGSV